MLEKVATSLEMPRQASVTDVNRKLTQVAKEATKQPSSEAAKRSLTLVQQKLKEADPDIAKALGQQVSIDRGVRLEDDGMALYGANACKQVDRKKKMRFCPLTKFKNGPILFKVTLCGQIDGLEVDSGERIVIEHKQRSERLFHHIVRYEEVQLLAYMLLCKCRQGKLVETLDQTQAVHKINWCNDLWSQVIIALKETLRERVAEPYLAALKEISPKQLNPETVGNDDE